MQAWKNWPLYFWEKDEFIDIFLVWLLKIKAESYCSIKVLQADDREEFISVKLRTFCEKRGIII